MPQIIPIRDFKNISEVSDIHQSAFYDDIEISVNQLKNGQVKDARRALADTRSKYAL